MLKKIDHINIVVTDLANSRKFFEAFGFIVESGARLSGEWISKVVGLPNVEADYVAMALPGTETRLELIQYKSPMPVLVSDISAPHAIGFRHIAFEVTNIYDVVKNFAEIGAKPLGDIQVFPKNGKKLIYFRGPDDILLELAEYSGDR